MAPQCATCVLFHNVPFRDVSSRLVSSHFISFHSFCVLLIKNLCQLVKVVACSVACKWLINKTCYFNSHCKCKLYIYAFHIIYLLKALPFWQILFIVEHCLRFSLCIPNSFFMCTQLKCIQITDPCCSALISNTFSFK